MRPALALFLLAIAAASTGASAAGSDPAAKKERRICRSEAETGTRMAKQECHLESEWKAIDAEREAELNANRRNLSGGSSFQPIVNGVPR